MLNSIGKRIAVLVIVLGIVSMALGGFFIQLGFAKADIITQTMVNQKITYGGAGGEIAPGENTRDVGGQSVFIHLEGAPHGSFQPHFLGKKA